jgi:hypothetical protein
MLRSIERTITPAGTAMAAAAPKPTRNSRRTHTAVLAIASPSGNRSGFAQRMP